MPAGRPTDYDPKYCDEVIDFLAKGHSVTAFAGEIMVARSTVFLWAKTHAEFSDALKIGQSRAVTFWEQVLTQIATKNEGNATAAIFGLKNRAADDWKDKQEHDVSGDLKITEIRRTIVDPGHQDS